MGTSKQTGQQELDKNLEVVSPVSAHKPRLQPRAEVKAPRAALLTQVQSPQEAVLKRRASCLFKNQERGDPLPPFAFLFLIFLLL